SLDPLVQPATGTGGRDVAARSSRGNSPGNHVGREHYYASGETPTEPPAAGEPAPLRTRTPADARARDRAHGRRHAASLPARGWQRLRLRRGGRQRGIG